MTPQTPVCGIYKITNLVNSKCYIGQSVNIGRRWKAHKYYKTNHCNPYLYSAFEKYGIGNFYFEVLSECQKSELDELERQFIAQNNSLYPTGYNLDGGGRRQKEISDITRQKQRLAHLGKKNHNYGKPKSELTKLRISAGQAHPVNKYTRDGKYLETFESTRAAAISLNKNGTKVISSCCLGSKTTAYGYQWRLANVGTGDIAPYVDNHLEMAWQSTCVPVSQFTRDGAYVASYGSITLAAKATGAAIANIALCCRGKRSTAGNYVWRHAV